MKKLPIKAAKDVSKAYDLDQVIILARDHKTQLVHIVTYGKTRDECGMAAMDGAKVQAMLNACPTSLADAIVIGSRVRPEDVNK